jgi:hypothetical protein
MRAETILSTLRRRGIRLRADGDQLVVEAPEGVLDESVRAAIRDHKPELLRLVSRQAANEGSHRPADDGNGARLLWWRIAVELAGRTVAEIDAPSGRTMDEWQEDVRRQYGGTAVARPLVRLVAGPMRITHADGWQWTLYPLYGLPMTRAEAITTAMARTGGAHGQVVAIEPVHQ